MDTNEKNQNSRYKHSRKSKSDMECGETVYLEQYKPHEYGLGYFAHGLIKRFHDLLTPDQRRKCWPLMKR